MPCKNYGKCVTSDFICRNCKSKYNIQNSKIMYDQIILNTYSNSVNVGRAEPSLDSFRALQECDTLVYLQELNARMQTLQELC